MLISGLGRYEHKVYIGGTAGSRQGSEKTGIGRAAFAAVRGAGL